MSIVAKNCGTQSSPMPRRLKAPDTTGYSHGDYIAADRTAAHNRHLAAQHQPNVLNTREVRRAIRQAVLRARLATLRELGQ